MGETSKEIRRAPGPPRPPWQGTHGRSLRRGCRVSSRPPDLVGAQGSGLAAEMEEKLGEGAVTLGPGWCPASLAAEWGMRVRGSWEAGWWPEDSRTP